jgi:hypothetical protein
MKGNFEKRLMDLERQQAKPEEFEFYWPHDEIPPEHRDSVIRLRWLDEVEKEH